MRDYYIIDNFIDEEYIDKILHNMEISSSVHLDGTKEKHLIGKTNYNYNIFRDGIRNNEDIKTHVFGKLNEFYERELGKTASSENLNPLQFFSKSFNPNEGFYDLHTEDPKYFGEVVFMLYLNDEVDGQLVLPSYEDSLPLWTDGFQTMVDNLNVEYVQETVEILPKRNRCVFVKVGMAHLVKPCSGKRYTVSGWSFADEQYYKEFYNR